MDAGRCLNSINKLTVFLFAILIAATFVSGFYQHDLWFADEPRETGIAMRMADEGNYAIPMLGKKQFLEKPPLYYWVGSAFIQLNANTFPIADVMRTSSVMFGIGILALTFWLALIWARNSSFSFIQQQPKSIAFLTMIILASCNGFLTNAITIRTDIALAFFMVLTAVGFSESYINKKNWGSVLAAVGLAGGFMAKGAVAIALGGLIWLVLFPLFLKLWHEKKSVHAFLGWHILLPLVIFLLPIAIWVYFLLVDGGQSAWNTWFIENTLTRFTGGGSLGHEEPNPLYYVEPFLIYTLPWGALWLLLSAINYRTLLTSSEIRTLQLWIILPLAFLMIATTKRPVYLLPLLPFIVLAFVFLWSLTQKQWLNIIFRILSIICLITILSVIVLASFNLEAYVPKIYRKIISLPSWAAIILAISMLGYFIYFNKTPILQLTQVFLFLLVGANLIVFPAENPERSRPELKQQLSQTTPEEWVKSYNSYMTEGLQGYLYTYYKYIPK